MPKERVERDEEDLVRLYLTDIGQYPLLTKDDEVRLAQAIEGGNEARSREDGPLLTHREIEILSWTQKGKSNGEIAEILGISQLTVKNHVQKILRKLGANNRTQAVAKGIALSITRGATDRSY